MEVDTSTAAGESQPAEGASQPSTAVALDNTAALLRVGEERIVPDPAVSIDLARSDPEVSPSTEYCKLHGKNHPCRLNACSISAVFSDSFSAPLLADDINRFNKLIKSIRF